MRAKVFSAIALASVMTLTCLLAIGSRNASATSVTIISEGFEEDSWYDGWYRTDHNSDSGSDYWGGTTYRSYAGSRSAWCSQVGSSSVNALPNYVNHYYDQNMQAALEVCLPDLSGYDSVTLSFEYWALTGTTSLSDYLEVRAWTGHFWQHIWKQPTVNSGGWAYIALSIPLETVWVSFTFVSDDIVGLGPYEGAYVDSVIIYGQDDTPPASSLDALEDYYTSSMIFLTYTAVDQGGSGVQHVELYYRIAGTAGYTKYTTEDKPDGFWTDTHVPFDSSLTGGDGQYDFYIMATDNAGNDETPTVIPQTSTTIDTAPPLTVATYPEPTGDGWWNASLTISLNASDATTGVAETWYRVDASNWTIYTDGIEMTGEWGFGRHNVSFCSVDLAGNNESTRQVQIGIDRFEPEFYAVGSFWESSVVDSSTVTVEWIAEDSQSGVAYTLFRVDDRAFEYFGPGLSEAEVRYLEEGEHELTFIAVDEAGNTLTVTHTFEVDLRVEGDVSKRTIATGWIVAAGVVIAAVLALLFLRWSRRAEEGS
jgi:hypothetical protein